MKRTIPFTAALCLLLVQVGRAEDLTAEQVKDLAGKPDDRSSVPEALRLYPVASEYEVLVRVWQPGQKEKAQKSPKITAREKLVEGKYLVSTFRPPSLDADFIMVVFHDAGEDVYKKYVLVPDGTFAQSVGTRVGDSRSMSWVTVGPKEAADTVVLTHEEHSEGETKWRAITMRKGKVASIEEGTAVVTKKAAKQP